MPSSDTSVGLKLPILITAQTSLALAFSIENVMSMHGCTLLTVIEQFGLEVLPIIKGEKTLATVLK